MNHIMLPYQTHDSVLQSKKNIKISVTTTRIAREIFFAMPYWIVSVFPQVWFFCVSYLFTYQDHSIWFNSMNEIEISFSSLSVVSFPLQNLRKEHSYSVSSSLCWLIDDFSECIQWTSTPENSRETFTETSLRSQQFGHIKFLCRALLSLLIQYYCPHEDCEESTMMCLNYALTCS